MHTGDDRGEDADFTEFTTARWAQLVRTAYMLTGDFHEAEDLVQTTLIKLHAQWRRVRPETADSYVRRALVNNNRSRYRKRRVVHLLTPFLPDVPHPPGDGNAATDALFDALAALAPRQRAVVVLRYLDDLSAEEVAHALGCTVGTVKSTASRALAKLRSHPALAGATLMISGDTV